jgi:hypothetical protein
MHRLEEIDILMIKVEKLNMNLMMIILMNKEQELQLMVGLDLPEELLIVITTSLELKKIDLLLILFIKMNLDI